jgi:bacteriorhodopsin
MSLLKKSAYASLIIQFITGLVDLWGLSIGVPSNIQIYQQLLVIELVVQAVEFIFYVWLVKNIEKPNITKYRYFDWFITTPSMLLTLMIYLDNNRKEVSILEYIKNNFRFIALIFILNWMMLGFGLLGELKIMNEKQSATLGFIPFVIYYYMIYQKFIDQPNTTQQQKSVYFYFLFVWTLYGVAALLPYEYKNSMYNILDLFAKNFFGLFLVYIIYQNKTPNLIK